MRLYSDKIHSVFQELLRQSQLPPAERSRLWENDEKCLPEHEGATTWHEGKI